MAHATRLNNYDNTLIQQPAKESMAVLKAGLDSGADLYLASGRAQFACLAAGQ